MDEDPLGERVQSQEQNEVDSELLGTSQDFDSALSAQFPEPVYKKIKTIGAFIMRGITLEEACILSRVPHARMTALMENSEIVREFIRFKNTAYKAALLKTLSHSGTAGGNMKSAGWLLEQKFAEEFGKSRADGPRTSDVIEEAIRFVRGNGDISPLVRVQSRPHTPSDSGQNRLQRLVPPSTGTLG